MSKVSAIVDVLVTVSVEIDSNRVMMGGRNKWRQNIPFTEEQIQEWLKKEWKFSAGNYYETDSKHGRLTAGTGHRVVKDVAVVSYNAD